MGIVRKGGKMSKDSFVLYNSFYEPLKSLTDEQLGRLMRAIFEYKIGKCRNAQTGAAGIANKIGASMPDFDAGFEIDPDIAMAFKFIKYRLDTDEKKYFEVVEKRRQAGASGSKARRRQTMGKGQTLSDTDGEQDCRIGILAVEKQNVSAREECQVTIMEDERQAVVAGHERQGSMTGDECHAVIAGQECQAVLAGENDDRAVLGQACHTVDGANKCQEVDGGVGQCVCGAERGRNGKVSRRFAFPEERVGAAKCRQKKQMPANQADNENVSVDVNDMKESINLSVYTKEKGNIDPSFIEEKFKEPFMRWLNYKKARKELYANEDSLLTCYAKLLRESADDALVADAMIENAIGNNYRGFFPLKNYPCGGPRKNLMSNKSADVTAYNLKWFTDKYGKEALNAG